MSGPTEPGIPFVTNCSYPARPGNLVRPLIDGVPTFRRICQAIDEAKHSVWITVAFCAPEFQMPDGRGSLFDVLDLAAERGLDVRVIFWRPGWDVSRLGRAFSGSPSDRDLLHARGSRFRIRWDRDRGDYCHHQKSWLIDAGRPSETAFVGGVNLTAGNDGLPGHVGENQRHDVYVEIAGPSATDVHHHFVQRWNGASERASPDGTWGHDGDDGLNFPTHLSRPQGKCLAQIQRTVHAGCYRGDTPSPHGERYDIADGEQSIFKQYVSAIDAAKHTIYIENQAIPIPAIAERLEAALGRGVDVVALVPGEPEKRVRTARSTPKQAAVFERLASLGRFDNFTLAGIAGRGVNGARNVVYVHAKIMLIDDAWSTIGSCNLHSSSLYGNTEMNVSLWDSGVVRALRCELFSEHLDMDTAHLDDVAALRLYRQIADDNRSKRDGGTDAWQGNAFRLDAATYAT